MMGKYGPDEFIVYANNGSPVEAKYLQDGKGDYVLDPMTLTPYTVPRDYDLQREMNRFEQVRTEAHNNADLNNIEFSIKTNLYQAIVNDFKQGGQGDLQRFYDGSNHGGYGFVKAFTPSASFNTV